MKKVIIVGAGPVGMSIALDLAGQGISCILLETNKSWNPCGSRAIVLDRGTLLHFQHIGCLDEVLSNGLQPLRRRTFFGKTELYVNEFPRARAGEIPLLINLPQSETERILLQKIEGNSLITVMWGCRLDAIIQNNADGVKLQVVQNGQTLCMKCTYLVAADGCRSTVRHLCNMDFPGTTNPAHFLIVDIKAELPYEKEHRFYFSHPTNPGRTLLMVPQPDDVWRIDWQLPHMSDAKLAAEQTIDKLTERIRKVIGSNIPFSINWSSCYQFHQRLIPKMSQENIFFVGDAAHLVNPFGARGLNSGIQEFRMQ